MDNLQEEVYMLRRDAEKREREFESLRQKVARFLQEPEKVGERVELGEDSDTW